MDMDDMVRMMMGGGGGMMGGMGGMGGPQRRRKGKDVGHAFPVTLEDLYKGKVAHLPREKTILCPQCKGSGSSKPGQSAVCTSCRGQGARIMMRQIGPGMMQQMQVPCDSCNGRGSALRDQDKCKSCHGVRTKSVEQPLTVRIEPGMEHEQQIPFPGEGDQSPDYEMPGAIVIVLRQLKHDTFTRDGDDLHIKKKISLADALCGGCVSISHLDDTILDIVIKPEDMIKPGSVKCVKGMGMPVYGRRGSYGDLVITFEVEFPEVLHEEALESLRKVLPPPAAQARDFDEETAEEAYLSRTPLDEMRKEMEKEAEDDDDEDGGGNGVRCAAQ
jgi:DnaJ family protein A protein 2